MTEPNTTPEPKEQEPKTPDIAEALEKGKEGVVEEKVEGKEAAPEEKEKTYTQADWDKRQGELDGRISGLDKKLTETTKSSKEDVSRLEKALEEQQLRTEEARDLTFLRKVEEDGGDVDAAKTLVTREKASRALERDLAGRKRTLDEQETILAEAGKAKKAVDLIKEHKLEDDVVDELLACETPEKMEIKALNLRLEKGAIDAKPIVETDAGEKGKKTSTDDMSIEERMGTAMEDES